MEIKNKQICRLCLTTDRPLSNIHKAPAKDAPLSIQITSCVALEVYPGDKMPATICELCQALVGFQYRFKQMCKTADAALRQVPHTRKWPDALELPQFGAEEPFQLLEKAEPESDYQILDIIPESTDPDPPTVIDMDSVQVYKPEPADDILIFDSMELDQPPKHEEDLPKQPSPRPKLLNKILIHAVEDAKLEPQPSLKRNKHGNLDVMLPPEPPKVLETQVFPCAHCDRTFPLQQQLEMHEKNHTRNRVSACDQCPKKFFTKYDLAKHMAIHTGEKPHICPVCKKGFSRSTLLYRHQSIHKDAVRFECDSCDRYFLSDEELQKHAEKHKRERPFKCAFCPKSFAFKQGMERHEVVHSVTQPFPCSYCDESFNTRSNLLRHLAQHSGARPYPCKYCNKSYLLSHHLTRHVRCHVSNANRFTCYKCGVQVSSTQALVDHMWDHHNDQENPTTCVICTEEFRSEQETRQHMARHFEGKSYPCEFCDLEFLDEEDLDVHASEVHTDEQKLYEDDVAKNMQKTIQIDWDTEKSNDVNIVEIIPEEAEVCVNEEPVAKRPKSSNEKISQILNKLPKSIEVSKSKTNGNKLPTEIKVEGIEVKQYVRRIKAGSTPAE